MVMDAPIPDPYRHCETACTHELSAGVTVAELLGADGPHPAGSLLVGLGRPRDALFDEEHREAGGRREILPERRAV